MSNSLNAQCGPGEVEQPITGNGDTYVNHGTRDPNNVVGDPDAQGAEFNNFEDSITVHLTGIVPQGEAVSLFMAKAQSGGGAQDFIVKTSIDGVNWLDQQTLSINSTAYTPVDYTVNTPGGIQYVRIIRPATTNKNLLVDAVTFLYINCYTCNAEAGTMAVIANQVVCYSGSRTITNTASGQNTGAGFTTLYVLAGTADNLIDEINTTGSFILSEAQAGDYRIYAFNSDDAYPADPFPAIDLDVISLYDPATGTAAGCYELETGGAVFSLRVTPNTPVLASNSPICAGENLNLTTDPVAGATYNWTGPNSFTSSLQNPVISAATTAATGIYQLTVIVNGCPSGIGSTAATVRAKPVANPTSNSPVCDGFEDVLLTTTSVTGATYSWSGPNGFTSSLRNPVISPGTALNDGIYSLTVTSSNGCTAVANTTVDVVTTNCLADITLTKTVSTPTANLNDNVVFTITVDNNGPTDTDNIQVIDYLPAGVNYLSHTASLGTFTPATGLWDIGTMNNTGATSSATLSITVQLTGYGLFRNIAELISSNAVDPNSAPDNDDGDQSEDDEAAAEVTVICN